MAEEKSDTLPVSEDVQGVVEPEASSDEMSPPAKTFCGLTRATAFKLCLFVLLCVAIVLGLTVWDLDERIESLLKWLDENKLKGIVIFIALYAGLTGMSMMLGCLLT
jgi:hypothetical protein